MFCLAEPSARKIKAYRPAVGLASPMRIHKETYMRASISFVRLSRRAAVLMLLLFVATVTYAQFTPSDDSYVNSAAPTTNYGSAKTLDLSSAADTIFIRFDLTAVPSGYTGSSIAKATLKLYVDSVTKAGSFNVDLVNGTWTEKTIDYSNEPALGATIAASVPLTTTNKLDYVEVDITPAVVDWLNGTANDGIALVANSPLVATFDSKEATTTSHPAELDIVFASGGTITGVTTASGSGLIGGGTSGTLNISLINTLCGQSDSAMERQCMGVRKSQRRRRRHRDQRRSNRAFDGFHRDRIAGDDQRNTRARLARRSGLQQHSGRHREARQFRELQRRSHQRRH